MVKSWWSVSLAHVRHSLVEYVKPFLQTNNFIKEIIMTIVTTAPPYITVTERNYNTLYIMKKDITYRNILKRSKKSLRLSSKISLRAAFRSK